MYFANILFAVSLKRKSCLFSVNSYQAVLIPTFKYDISYWLIGYQI